MLVKFHLWTSKVAAIWLCLDLFIEFELFLRYLSNTQKVISLPSNCKLTFLKPKGVWVQNLYFLAKIYRVFKHRSSHLQVIFELLVEKSLKIHPSFLVPFLDWYAAVRAFLILTCIFNGMEILLLSLHMCDPTHFKLKPVRICLIFTSKCSHCIINCNNRCFYGYFSNAVFRYSLLTSFGA